jgi:tetratricopeptide (TPR) repeat protein
MSFVGESLQNKIWKFLVKYKKIVGVLCMLIFAGILSLTISSINHKHSQRKIVSIIIECQELEKTKQYTQAYKELQNIYSKYQNSLNSNKNLQYLINVYNYKLSLYTKNTSDAEEKLLKTDYYSQFWDYSRFSIAGESALLQKMIIHYNRGEYALCEEMYVKHKMQKLPHFIAAIYRAKAMIKLGQVEKAKEFLSQVFLYNHEYDRFSKLFVKSMLFLPD